MKLNVGGIDRILRILVGLALIVAAALGYIGWWGYIGVAPARKKNRRQFMPQKSPESIPGLFYAIGLLKRRKWRFQPLKTGRTSARLRICARTLSTPNRKTQTISHRPPYTW